MMKITFHRSRKKRATSVTTTPAESNLNREILDELGERLGNLHDSDSALASCHQTRDVTRNTDQSMIEAAKCTFLKLLGDASHDLERVTPQPRESLHIETTREQTSMFSCRDSEREICMADARQVVRRCCCRFHRHRQIVQGFAL